MTGLPDADRAFIEERKILDYLLRDDHPDGGAKARFFLARGFSRLDWRLLADALLDHGRRNAVADARPGAFGTLYEVRCTLRTPDGRDPCIRTVWQIRDASSGPPLITAYPFDG